MAVEEVSEYELALAKESNFQAQDELTTLSIAFNHKHISKDKSEIVLNGLQPHIKLRYLEILYYRGENLPSWMIT